MNHSVVGRMNKQKKLSGVLTESGMIRQEKKKKKKKERLDKHDLVV